MPDASRADQAAAAAPCRTCPWLTVNHGRNPDPDGWFTTTNRRRLWRGLRGGQPMSCHRTDPNLLISERAVEAGFRPVPEGTTPRECTGALILIQRELQELVDAGQVRAYQGKRPGGLTRSGIQALLARYLLGGVIELPMSTPDLNAPVSHGFGALDWTPRTPQEAPCGASE